MPSMLRTIFCLKSALLLSGKKLMYGYWGELESAFGWVSVNVSLGSRLLTYKPRYSIV